MAVENEKCPMNIIGSCGLSITAELTSDRSQFGSSSNAFGASHTGNNGPQATARGGCEKGEGFVPGPHAPSPGGGEY